MVEAKLAIIEYDLNHDIVNGCLPEKSIFLIDEVVSEQYVLGTVEDTDYWQVETHIRYKKANKKNSQIAQLVLCDDEDELDCVTTFEGVAFKVGTASFKGFGVKVFFMTNQFMINPVTNKKMMSDVPTTVTTAGVQSVKLRYKSGKAIDKKIIILPTISTEYYLEMIQDLVRINQKLIENQDSNICIESYWDSCYEKYKKIVDDLEIYLEYIEKSPKGALETITAKRSIYNMKHVDNRAIIKAAITGAEKVDTKGYSATYNIYEHRIIKSLIKKLKSLMQEYAAYENQENESFLTEVDDSGFVCRTTGAYSELEQFVDEIFSLSYTDFLKRKEKLITQYREKGDIQTVELRVKDIVELVFDKTEMTWGVHSGHEAESYDSTPFQGVYSLYHTKWIKFVGISVDKNSKYQLLFLDFCATIINEKFRNKNGFKVVFKGYAKERVSKDNNSFKSYWISEVEIDDEIYSFDEFCKKDNREDNVKFVRADMKNNPYKEKDFYKIASDRKSIFIEQRKQNKEHTHKFINLYERLDGLINKYRFLDVPLRDEKLIYSNLFKRDKNYRRIYELLSGTQEINALTKVSFFGINAKAIQKSERIYEYWCYIKILDLLINIYGFKVVKCRGSKEQYANSNEALVSYIDEFLENGNANETHFDLYLQSFDLWATVYSQARIPLDKEPPKYGKIVELTPDYYLEFYSPKFHSRKDNVYRFCFDAKYKAFEKMEKQLGKERYKEWLHDLFDVAVYKYIKRINLGTSDQKEIDGSFIIHSDISSYLNDEEIWDIKQYYGGINGELLNKYKSVYDIAEYNDINDKLQYRIGSIALLPGHDFYLKNLFRLIFEHIIGKEYNDEVRWRKKCWICGSEHVESKTRMTEGNIEKYHVTCNKCAAFWVQTHCARWNLGDCHTRFAKHDINYFMQNSSNTSWNIYCPECNREVGGELAWFKRPNIEQRPF